MKSSRATLRNPDELWEHETMDAILDRELAGTWAMPFRPALPVLRTSASKLSSQSGITIAKEK